MPDPVTLPYRPRSFHVIVKPVGAACNLNCTYCYYRHKAAAGEPIADELLEAFIAQYLEQQELSPVRFNWHGGEPTLLGLDFFARVVELQRKYARGKEITNELQTNGTLLDDAWCAFLKEHDFVVGLSIDGPKHLHDAYRRGDGDTPSFDRTMRGARLLQRHAVPFNTLTVVHARNARHPEEVYRFLVDELGATRLQWLPCVARKDFRTVDPACWSADEMPVVGTPAARPGRPESVATDWSVDPDDWGELSRARPRRTIVFAVVGHRPTPTISLVRHGHALLHDRGLLRRRDNRRGRSRPFCRGRSRASSKTG